MACNSIAIFDKTLLCESICVLKGCPTDKTGLLYNLLTGLKTINFTSIMAEIAKNVFLQLFSEKCYNKYVFENDFFNADCFKIALSKGLGIGIIAGSLLVKIPQILKIIANKSGEGINVISVLLDLFAISSQMSYSFASGFPFSAWGESTFLALQTATIAALVLYYGRAIIKSFGFVVCYSIACYMAMSGFVQLDTLWSMQVLNIPILIVGRMTQVYTNFKNQSTGQLSAVTYFMLLGGSLARIFTSIQETGDSMMILTFVVSSLLNVSVVVQILYYWSKPTKKGEGRSKFEHQNKKIKAKKLS